MTANQRMNNQPHALRQITCLGAALEVTGSCHLLECNGKKILLDCGMHQGSAKKTRQVDGRFDFEPKSIDIVVLSHAHLDHSGLLPKLVHGGFGGPIYCTRGSLSLLKILLQDAFKIYSNDLAWKNKRRSRGGKQKLTADYSAQDVEDVLDQCRTRKYRSQFQIAKGIDLQFFNAGHILGSAIVELSISDGSGEKKVVFSGDLGNPDTALMPDPSVVTEADLLLLESTYGDRNHRSSAETHAEFLHVIQTAHKQGGNILIPAFAVGRTQELLFQLGCLFQQGKLKGWKVFLDSPMAAAVTKIYDQYINRLDKKDTAMMRAYGSMSLRDFLPILHVSESVEESMAINKIESRAIIIAGSGMCTGGRIRHHFKQRIWRADTNVIFVGFQAGGTLGRRLVTGAERIRFFRQEYAVKAQIHTIGGFSAHAGQQQLIEWVGNFPQQTRVCLVHGEREAIVELSRALYQQLGMYAQIGVKGAPMPF